MTASPIDVRRLEARDLQGVVDLYRACFFGAALRPRAEVERKLAQLFIDGPLCDPRLPSFVACDAKGDVVGFTGRLRRGWRFGEECLLAYTGTGLMVRSDLRRFGVASALRRTRRELENEPGMRPDLGYGDRATADGRAFGASDTAQGLARLEQYGFDWSLPLRPGALRVLGRLGRRLPPGARRQLVRGLEASARRPAPAPALRSAPLSPGALQEAIEAAGQGRALRIDESRDTWAWLLDYLADYPSRGRFSGRVFLAESGSPLGFCASYRNDAGGSELLGFAVASDAEQTALDDVLAEAAASGALFVSGTACARELRPLLERGAEVSRGARAAVRCLRPAVIERFQAMDVLISGLEGERWL
jgi:hypothetical protein